MRWLTVLLLMLSTATAQPRVAVVADPSLSAEAGAQTIVAARAGLSAVQDRVLPLRLGAERTALGKTLGVGYRLARLGLIDVPVETFAGLVQHEVFGHGARQREFGWELSGYVLRAPFPYGAGGGSAGYRAPGGITDDERGALAISGSHANTVLADVLAEDAVQRGRMPYRDALLYIGTASDALLYVRSSDMLSETTEVSDDAASWRASLNLRARDLGLSERVSPEEAKAAALTALLDPLLYVGMYGVVKEYLWSGFGDVRVPMIRIGEMRYLPAMRFDWGPHGGEMLLDHRFRRGEHTALVRMRGSAPAVQRAWGVGAAATSLVHVGEITLDGSADVWSQPALRLDPAAGRRETGGGLGGAVRVTAHVPVAWAEGRASILVQAGLKTAGFVGADPLEAGPIVRVGLSLRERAHPGL